MMYFALCCIGRSCFVIASFPLLPWLRIVQTVLLSYALQK
nr:MAG TPA: hypothetical protein [Caudoviricetes sp.]